MIKLILLFLMFNLSLEIYTVEREISSQASYDRNSSDMLPQSITFVGDSNTTQSKILTPVMENSSKFKRIPRQFSIKKKYISVHPQGGTRKVLTNSSNSKKNYCIHCHPKVNNKVILSEKNALPVNSLCCKPWNSNLKITPNNSLPKPKKKILIFMSKGGGGHISVSNALKSYLEEDYDITIANFFEDVISSIDTVRYLTFGQASGEDIYNFCLQNRYISLVNGFTRFGAWTLRQKSASMEPLIQDFVALHKPDLIISVIPVVNFIILKAAQKFNIPFLVVTNDLDTTNYINGIDRIDYSKFYYAVPFNDKNIYKKFRSVRIPKRQVAVTGFPLRPEFYDKTKNASIIKQDFQIPPDKKTVMILMGGAGSFVCYRYVQALIRSKKPMHIVVCIGRDERLRTAINGLTLPSYITLSVVGFTNRISDLMSVSNLLITKAGPNSICEAMASYLPILIDQTTSNIWWEILNVDFVKKNKIGDTVKKFKEVNGRVTKFLDDASYVRSIKSRMAKIQAGIDFRQRIRCLIHRIIC